MVIWGPSYVFGATLKSAEIHIFHKMISFCLGLYRDLQHTALLKFSNEKIESFNKFRVFQLSFLTTRSQPFLSLEYPIATWNSIKNAANLVPCRPYANAVTDSLNLGPWKVLECCLYLPVGAMPYIKYIFISFKNRKFWNFIC